MDKPEHAYDNALLFLRFPLAGSGIIARFPQYLVGNEILTGTVALDNGGHHILGHIGIIGKQLLGIFGQAITAIAETGIVIMGTDTRVKAYALDYCPASSPFTSA